MKEKDGARVYFDKLKMAETFCDGDVEMARKILKGEVNDVIVLKGRFKDEDDEVYGLFMTFLGKLNKRVVVSYAVVSGVASLYLHKPFTDWKMFYDKLQKELTNPDVDKELSETFVGVLQKLEQLNFFPSIFDWVEENDIQNMTDKFRVVTSKVINKNVNLVIDYEYITSITLYDMLNVRIC